MAIGLALLVAALALARGVSGELGIGSLALGDREGEGTAIVHVRATASPGTGERVAAVAFGVITAQLESDPEVAGVRVAGGGGDGRTRLLTLTLASGDEGERQRLAGELTETIDPGPLRVSVEGEAIDLARERDRLGGELWELELLALPVVLLLLGWGLGVRAGLAAAGATALAIAGVPALLRIGDLFGDVSLLGVAAGTPVGMVTAIELTRLLTQRHREALAIGAGHEALRLALAEWSRSAVVFVLAATVAPLGLLLTPLAQAGSLALGCAAGAMLAAAGVALFGSAALAGSVESRAAERSAAGRLASRLTTSRIGLVAATGAPLALLGLALLGGDVESRGLAAPLGGGSLPAELPAAAGVAALATGALIVVVARALRAFPLGLAAVIPAAAAFGLVALAFVETSVAENLGMDRVEQLDTAALAAALAAVVAICAGRSAVACLLVADERRLGLEPGAAAANATATCLAGAVLASLCVAVAAGVLAGADTPSAQQFGCLLAAGLLLDVAVVRLATVTLASRLIGLLSPP